MKIILIFSSIVCAFFVENTLSRIIAPAAFPPPITLFTLFYWLWRVQGREAVILSILAGFFLESVSIFPPGSYVVVLLVVAAAISFFKRIIANPKSIWVIALSVAMFLFSFLSVSWWYASAAIHWKFVLLVLAWPFVFSCLLVFSKKYVFKKERYKKLA